MSQKDDDSTPVVGASSENLDVVNSDLTGLSLDPAGNEETARIAELSGKMSADDLDEGPEDAQQVAESSHQGFMNGDEYRKGKEEGEAPAAKAEEIQDEAKGLEEKEKEKEEGYGEDNAARLGHHLEDREAKGTNQEPSKDSGPSDLRSNNGYGKEGHPNSMDYFSDQRTSQPHTDADLLHNSATRNEEGHSRQRILAFASKRYAQAVERNPEDYDALYNWALVLQESADNLSAEDTGGPGKDQLLEEACKKYQEATRLCPTLHEAFYNWAIAVADRAKMRRRTKEAEELWKQACKNYERAVRLHWSSPQALNNWGLALQELSGIVAVRDKQLIVRTAIKKFRAAIQLQFDFHRAIYNLGTVLYGLAEDMFRSGRQGAAKESTPSDLYSQSAVYIAAAHALKPEYPVYRSALRLVRSMLPLPYLKTGYLIVPPDGDALAPHIDWKRLWFVLDQEAIYQMEKVEQKSLGQSPSKWMGSTASDVTGNLVDTQPVARVEVSKISHLSTCSDLSLPPGGGFCIDTVDGQQYFVAETWEAVDGWVDAIRLVYTIFVKGQSGVLGGILGG